MARLIVFCAALFFAARSVRAQTPDPQGAAIYARTCAVCHGEHGEGYKADRAPALNSPAFLASASDAYLREAVAEGRPGTNMSAWSAARGGPLSPEDLARLLGFLRAWGAQGEPDPRASSGDASLGALIYAAECSRCHGPRGTEGPEAHIGSLAFLKSADDGYLRRAIRDGRPGTPMIAYGSRAGAAGVEDLVVYLRRLQSEAPPAPARLQVSPSTGPVVLNPGGPEPAGFQLYPQTTPVDVVKGQLDRGAKMALLDARAPSDYAAEHIAGALSVPFYGPEPAFARLPKDVWLVCYCACPRAESGQLAQKLLDRGFKKVTVLDEGIRIWKTKLYPVRSGNEP